jgi:hypothetical protein
MMNPLIVRLAVFIGLAFLLAVPFHAFGLFPVESSLKGVVAIVLWCAFFPVATKVSRILVPEADDDLY